MKTALLNGHFYLGQNPSGEAMFASSVLLNGNTIEAVGGGRAEDMANTGGCRIIDLGGKTVLPGFNDTHMHLYGIGQKLLNADLTGATSIDEIVERCRAFLVDKQLPEGAFLSGRGWNQDILKEGRMPDRHDLDRISTKHPIQLSRLCGHATSSNTYALELAGISAETQVSGGEILLGDDGAPNGILTENASALVRSLAPQPSSEEMSEIVLRAMGYAVSKGLTSIQTDDLRMGYEKMLAAYGMLYQSGRAPLRIIHQCRFTEPDPLRAFVAQTKPRSGDDMHRIGPIKMLVDGSLGARTSLMFAPFEDDPGNSGVACMPQAQLDEMVRISHEAGYQVVIHAIGDLGAQWCLEGFAKANGGGPNTLRHGLVHCQILTSAQIERIRDEDILALVQPIFINTDWPGVRSRVGEVLERTAYPYGTLLKIGVHTSYGTDAPVEDLAPLENIHCAVNRTDLNGQPAGGFLPNERVTVAQAVDAYTAEGAYCSGDEAIKGRIAEGMLADLVVLDQDIFTCPTDRIKDIGVAMTMVDGNVVFEEK